MLILHTHLYNHLVFLMQYKVIQCNNGGFSLPNSCSIRYDAPQINNTLFPFLYSHSKSKYKKKKINYNKQNNVMDRYFTGIGQ